MDKVKTFYNFEKIYERGQKKFKKIIAHNVLHIRRQGLELLNFQFSTDEK